MLKFVKDIKEKINMKKIYKFSIYFAGIVLLLVGSFMILKPYIYNSIENFERQKKITSYKSVNKKEKINYNDKSKMIGYLVIPEANIEEPVYPGPATPQQLKRGVSLVGKNEKLEEQNISIAGHTDYTKINYQFTDLTKVKKGSIIYFKFLNKNKVYKIVNFYDVNPTDTTVLKEEKSKKKRLTLITCNDYDYKTGLWKKRRIYIAEEDSR